MTETVTVLDCYRDENLAQTFGNEVLASLRQIPAEWRQSCMAHVASLTTRTEWILTEGGLMAKSVPTGVDQRQAWAETLAAFRAGWRLKRMESPVSSPGDATQEG